jgi:molybdate transport system permease protein
VRQKTVKMQHLLGTSKTMQWQRIHEHHTTKLNTLKKRKVKLIAISQNKRIEYYFIGTASFFLVLYSVFILGILGSNLFFTDLATVVKSFFSNKTFHSIYLSLGTSIVATLSAIIVGIPAGYALSRFKFPGKKVFDMIINIPITLPPLVAGLSLLIFFSTGMGRWIEANIVDFSFKVTGIVLAQFIISASFAVITLKLTFDEVEESYEIAARSLGCNRFQAFWKITLPSARYGIASAVILTWSRAIGEFVPILLFCGAMEGKTDILPIAIFLNIEVGNLEGAIGLMMIFIILCLAVLPLASILTRKNKSLID